MQSDQVPMSSIPDSVTNFVSKISLGNPLYIRASSQQEAQASNLALGDSYQVKVT